MLQTNVRLMNQFRQTGGEYFIPPDKPDMMQRVWKDLAEYQELEPHSDWHLETRGELVSWHKWRP